MAFLKLTACRLKTGKSIKQSKRVMKSSGRKIYKPSRLKHRLIILLLIILSVSGCKKDPGKTINEDPTKNLTIFFVNDQHGQIDNFAKIKHIVDAERLKTNVIVACSGDMFSGNPVVDNYPEKGYPMIDIMNKVGFDITALGNHEFDYGEVNLKSIMEQADFYWVCANVNMGSTGVPEPFEYKTVTVDNLKVTFLGLIETDGKQDAIIPSAHPWKVQNFTFNRPEYVIYKYSNVKEQENSDLFIALSHLGYSKSSGLGDYQLAGQFPYFDLIIGGHSHSQTNTTVNNIPIFQAGGNLNYLGEIDITVKAKKIETIKWNLIDLNNYPEYDAVLKADIDHYNGISDLNEVIGYSQIDHDQSKVGCFMVDAMRLKMNVDVSFQNPGGVRSGLNKGDITKKEIYEISPFNNGTIIYNMTVTEIKNFLMGSRAGFYYSGIKIQQNGSNIQISDLSDHVIPDNTILSVGVIDYIPAVYDTYFPSSGNIQSLSDAETIISYLIEINSQVNYSNCNNYFKYQ